MERGAWPDSVEYWHNLRVMVTGGAGFLGRHVVAKLRERGATQIEVVDRDRYDPSTALRTGSFDSAQDRFCGNWPTSAVR